jgi:hypothetical protein
MSFYFMWICLNDKSHKKTLPCFWCQAYGHKADFSSMAEHCIKCAGHHSSCDCTSIPTTPVKCAKWQGNHAANYKNCLAAVKFANQIKIKQGPVSNMSSRQEFTSLPSRAAYKLSPSTNVPENWTGLKEIL